MDGTGDACYSDTRLSLSCVSRQLAAVDPLRSLLLYRYSNKCSMVRKLLNKVQAPSDRSVNELWSSG